MANNWTLSLFLLAASVAATNPSRAQTAVPGGPVRPEIVQLQPAPVAPPAPPPGPILSAPTLILSAPTPVAQTVVPAPVAPAAPSFAPGFAPPVQVVPGGPITAALVLPLNLEPGTGLLVQLPRPASTVIAADPRVVRVTPASPSSLFMVGVAVGRTNVIVTNETGAPIIQYDVVVRRGGGADGAAAPAPAAPAAAPVPTARGGNASQIEATLRQHVPGAGGVKVAMLDGAMVVSGTIGTPLQAQQLDQLVRTMAGERAVIINRVEVLSSMQVNVRVRVAEMSRDVARNLGINWRILGGGGTLAGGLRSPGQNGLVGGDPIVTTAANFATGFRFLDLGRGVDINGVLEALASNNLVSILAEPNLTTMSGEAASFLAGGEFPIPVPTGGASGTVGVEFKQFGVSLAVVPTVIGPGKISLRIRPEVSEPDPTLGLDVGTGRVFGVSTRRAETTVELGSGQSFAIAGLLSNKVTDSLASLPWLGELPILGALFRSSRFTRHETELVIIVTPYLVRPVDSPALVRAPTDGFRPATDLGRMLHGRQNRSGEARPAGSAVDAGFILK